MRDLSILWSLVKHWEFVAVDTPNRDVAEMLHCCIRQLTERLHRVEMNHAAKKLVADAMKLLKSKYPNLPLTTSSTLVLMTAAELAEKEVGAK